MTRTRTRLTVAAVVTAAVVLATSSAGCRLFAPETQRIRGNAVWAHDSSAVLVKVAPAADSPVTAAEVSELPARPVGAPGGAYSDGGLLLMVEEDESQTPIRLFTLLDETWLPFHEVPLVSPADLEY